MSTDNSNNSTNANKVPVIIYSGVAPGLYGIEVDCVPEHDYHVYVGKELLYRYIIYPIGLLRSSTTDSCL